MKKVDENIPKLSRRGFLFSAAGAVAAIALGGLTKTAYASGPFQLPELPFANDALEPIISARTLSFHYGKHHNGYMKKLNRFISGTKYENMELAEIIKQTAGNPSEKNIFKNAAQFWNHTFYWNSLKPNGGGRPPAILMKKLEKSFGSFEKFKEEFATAAGSQFGSGWAWLVADGNDLKVVKTPNAGNPMTNGLKPLLTIDVWEHAYYLDYQNRRGDYVKAVIDKLLNWQFAIQNM